MHPVVEGILAASRARGFQSAVWPKDERRDLISSARALKGRGLIPIIAEIKPKALGRALIAGRGGSLRQSLCGKQCLRHLGPDRAHSLQGLSGKRPDRPESRAAGFEKGLHLRRVAASGSAGRSGAADRLAWHRSGALCGHGPGLWEWSRWWRSIPRRSWRRR